MDLCINTPSLDHSFWSNCLGDTSNGREEIQPEVAIKNQMQRHDFWERLKWESGSDQSNSLFSCLDAPLNFRDVLIWSTDVKDDLIPFSNH